YGTTGIDTNPYGFNEFSWLMEITVKDECRRASGLITFPELTEQKLFIDWFLQKNTKQDLQKFTSECMGWTSDYYRVFQTERCQDIVQTFLQEKDVKVLQDAASQKSFYLRDRNCIESIRATPLQILEMHGDRPELWITSCNEYAQPTRGDILLRALYEVEQPVDAGLMERLKLNLRLVAAASDFYKLWPSMLSEALKAHERCLSGRDFGIATFQKAMTPFLDRLAASKNPPQMEWTAADISVIKKTCVP
ncbi:MAG: hypothetical protein ACXVBE_17305, partial [Bdellovibrionota bacterium]